MATNKKEWKDMSVMEKVLTVLILPIIIVIIIAVASAILGGDKKTDKPAQKTEETSNQTDAESVPKFDSYLNRPIAEVAAEFGQQYDAGNSTQIRAEKDGYKLFFEDGGRDDPADPLKKQNTEQVTTVNIELPQMGKCQQGQVFNKIDEAMRLANLNTNTKGDKSGTQPGYAVYKNYLDKESLELSLICEYNDANYKLQLRVLPDFR